MLPYPQCCLLCAPVIKARFTVLSRQGRGVILYSATADKEWSQVSSSHSLWACSPVTPQTRASSSLLLRWGAWPTLPSAARGDWDIIPGLMTPSGRALLPTVVRAKEREGVSPLSKPLHSKQEAGPSFPCPCLPGSWSESPKSRASCTLLLNQGRLSLEAGFQIIYAHVWPVCRQPLFAACGWRLGALGFISGSNKRSSWKLPYFLAIQ